MRIAVDMGHTASSTGASGYINEYDENRNIGYRIISELENRGHAVLNATAPDNYTYPDEINYRVNAANNWDAELFVSIHFNAGGGSGSEAYYYPGSADGQQVASRISSNISGLMGIDNRGSKSTTVLGVINSTNMTAVLVEVCFVDSQNDANKYNESGYDAIANAIVNGITNEDKEIDCMPLSNEDIERIWQYRWIGDPEGRNCYDKLCNVSESVNWDNETKHSRIGNLVACQPITYQVADGEMHTAPIGDRLSYIDAHTHYLDAKIDELIKSFNDLASHFDNK